MWKDPDIRARFLAGVVKGTATRQANAKGNHGRPEYAVWSAMTQRCLNPRNKAYHRYGGRGVRVCKSWQGRGGFERFLADVGPRPSMQHSIDRIDNDGHYEPGNVRWATTAEQNANTSRVRLVTIAGRTQHLAAWSRETGIPPVTLGARLAAGWPEARLLEPLHATGRPKMG